MKSIVTTYPYFQSLPKGIKMMLVASEEFFFQESFHAHATPAPRTASLIGSAGHSTEPLVSFGAGVPGSLPTLTATSQAGHARAVEMPAAENDFEEEEHVP